MSIITRTMKAPACTCCGGKEASLVRDDEYMCPKCARSQAIYEGAFDQLETRVSSAITTAIKAWEVTWQGEDFVTDRSEMMRQIIMNLVNEYCPGHDEPIRLQEAERVA